MTGAGKTVVKNHRCMGMEDCHEKIGTIVCILTLTGAECHNECPFC